ncbi:MAG: globin domain-containing protein [Thermonemataceae bacterium]|nr:globin domain-containing protein [Thermonemataceae bacterium]
MTNAQSQLVKQSFPKVLAGTLSGTKFLYEKLFELAPDSKELFKNTSMDKQAQMLIAAIGKLIKSIDQWDTVKPDLEVLAQRHIGYGLSPEHFVYFGQSFIYMLKNIFGADWNSELEDAWQAVYQRISEVMIGVIFSSK